MAEKPPFPRGPQANRRGHQERRVWLAGRHAGRNRSVGGGIYEVRSDLAQNRIARVLFYFDRNGRMVLLHGFIKETRKTPDEDLDLAQRNKKKQDRSR
jgi:phage-related protein